MYSILSINKKYLNNVRKEIISLMSIMLGKKLKDINNEFFNFLQNPNVRSKIFDLLNMTISLHDLNYKIAKKIQKKTKKKLINWTYPQIRVDGNFAKKFYAPPHKDEWILHKNKQGYIIWFPLNKSGASLLVSKRKKIKKIVHDRYWGIKCADKDINYKMIKVKFGQILLFDSKTLHKSFKNENRVTVQLRYEIFEKNFQQRTVNQKINKKIKDYWLKKVKA